MHNHYTGWPLLCAGALCNTFTLLFPCDRFRFISLFVLRTTPLESALLDLDTKTKVSMNVQTIKEISGVPSGTNAEGGYLAAGNLIHDIHEAHGDDAAIECLQVFTMCNAHDKNASYRHHHNILRQNTGV
eukprot:COSAG01_NODE_2862_length_6958_cov_21.483015_8_plen_130_part_00